MQVSRVVNNRVLTCKDFTSYKLRGSAEIEAEKICRERGLNETIVYLCGTCDEYHILDENPPFLNGH